MIPFSSIKYCLPFYSNGVAMFSHLTQVAKLPLAVFKWDAPALSFSNESPFVKPDSIQLLVQNHNSCPLLTHPSPFLEEETLPGKTFQNSRIQNANLLNAKCVTCKMQIIDWKLWTKSHEKPKMQGVSSKMNVVKFIVSITLFLQCKTAMQLFETTLPLLTLTTT